MSRGTRAAQERPQTRNLRMSMVKEKEKEKDEELALFLEMRKREKERDDLLLQSSEVIEAPLGAEQGRSPVFDVSSSSIPVPAKKNYSDEFLNSENDKNDYDWLITPPGTPLFPSLEKDSHRAVVNQVETSKPRPVALKSRLANAQLEAAAKSNLPSRQSNPAPSLNTSSMSLRRSSSSCGPISRPATPTGRTTLTSSSPKSTLTTSKSIPTLPTRSSKPTVTSSSKPSRSSTPTSRATLSSTTKSTVPVRPSSPQSRTTARSSTPTTTRPTLPASNRPPSRSATPTRRTPTASTVTNTSSGSVKSHSVVASRPAAAPTTTTTQPRPSSPTVKSRSWNPSEMPGFSLDAPPNLRTTLPDRPLSATRGRPGAPSSRSSSVEPGNTGGGRVRRQSCSPSRGRAPNGVLHGCGSSVPAMSRLHAKANDNISPVLIGTKMVERVINMRKLAPPRQDDRHSPLSNFSGKSSSPDGSGFGRSLSKKSLDMAIRHMDIRRTIPGNLRPLMTNIPASSMYSVRSGHSQSRTVSISDSPLATSSNASSEMSVNNSSLYPEGNEVDEVISSRRRRMPSPSRVRGR
ncbi:serine/arginine repetitive matrix protein 2 [Impatiens glandulifera]|uniref:serine/arginine repetitive matrix protein 2 n=1 Tax=Impatiens glandulifera TaxID=253017 RepID=UPI001FB15CA1|nr:serine/arginine repetitive matrix protein 2 [Impatiens glandulifera]